MAAQFVSQVMTPSPVALPAETSVADAARMMREHGIGDVLVTDGGRLRGLVTDRDIVVRTVAEGHDPGRTALAEMCSADLVVVRAEDSVDVAIALMRERGIRRIPVVDGEGAIGIVSIGDLAIERDGHSALADISAKPANI